MKRYIIALTFILIFLLPLYGRMLRLTINLSDPAVGLLYVNVQGDDLYFDNNTQYHAGDNYFQFSLNGYDNLNYASFVVGWDAMTEWGAYFNSTIQVYPVNYDDPNTDFAGYAYHTFWHPQPISVFINPNMEIEQPVLKIYDGLDRLLDTRENFTLEVGVWNQIIFEGLDPMGYGWSEFGGPTDESYAHCYATIEGITQNGIINPPIQTTTNFVYNNETGSWENYDLELLFDYYHNFREFVITNVNIDDAIFKLKDPSGSVIATQTANITGNHIKMVSFDNILNPQGMYNPAEYKLYYEGASIVNETKIMQNETDNLNYDTDNNYWYNNTYNIQYTANSEVKLVHNGWNWVSFPRLTAFSQEATWVLDPLTPYVSEIRFETTQYALLYDDYAGWYQADPQNQFINLIRIFGYKLHMDEEHTQYNLTILGNQQAVDTTIQLVSQHENWIGYWLPITQNWYDAIGNEQLAHITSIKAEDWYLYKKHGQWYGMIGQNGATFEYGKAYVITVDQSFHLQWQYVGGSEPYVKEKPENFTYEEKADYQMIEIESIENGEDVAEVGVFQGDTCVGASKVNGYPVHLMAYTDDVNKDEEISFEIITHSKSKKRYDTVLFYNFEKNNYQPAKLYANRDDFMLIKLDKNGYTQVPEKNIISLNNYPNPFNPETKITFSLPKDEKIRLEIYNIQGQKVKTLVEGYYPKGKYDIIWKGNNDAGKKIGSGLYLYRLITKEKKLTKKMLLLK